MNKATVKKILFMAAVTLVTMKVVNSNTTLQRLTA